MKKSVREFSCSGDFQLARFSNKLSAEASRVSPHADHSLHDLELPMNNSMAISDVMDDETDQCWVQVRRVHVDMSTAVRVKRYWGEGISAKIC